MAKPPPLVGRSAIGVAFSEGARNWPFVFGFAVTLGIVAWMSQNLDRGIIMDPQGCSEVTLHQP